MKDTSRNTVFAYDGPEMTDMLKASPLTGLKFQFVKWRDNSWALHVPSHGVVIERCTDTQMKAGGSYRYTVHTPTSFDSGLEYGQLAAFWRPGAVVTWMRKHEVGLKAAVKAGVEYAVPDRAKTFREEADLELALEIKREVAKTRAAIVAKWNAKVKAFNASKKAAAVSK